VTVSAEGSRSAVFVLANVDTQGDPDSQEHSPVDEFEGEDEVMMRFRAVDHSRREDPKDGKDGPGTLAESADDHEMGGGKHTAATVNRISRQPVKVARVYAERDMTRTAKTHCEIRRAKAQEVLPIAALTIFDFY
jgi:hypothetical protein